VDGHAWHPATLVPPERPTQLLARSRALEDPPDLLSLAGDAELLFWDPSRRRGLAGQGAALEIELTGGLADRAAVASAVDTLAAMATEDEVGRPGSGAVAMGALPFDPSAPARLTVPSRVVGRDGDKGWETVIAPAGGRLAAPRRRSPGAPPDGFTLTLAAIGAGRLQKVVLARRVDISANRPFVIPDVLGRLAALYPSCMLFRMGGFLGASPELLVNRAGEEVASVPLAGTVARSGDSAADDALVAGLLDSPKARREHAVVVEEIARVLNSVCSELSVPEAPSVLALRNVSHLATTISGRLAGGGGGMGALELVRLLHPTPAVCGSPPAAALEYIKASEGFERGPYAGPVGWIDARGDGTWALGIRSACVSGERASIFAGNGVVAGSDPDEELAETQLKLQALLAALVRP
jgi:menaquinone-specific isochorismate synthase